MQQSKLYLCLPVVSEDYLHVYFTGIKMFLINLIHIRITTQWQQDKYRFEIGFSI